MHSFPQTEVQEYTLTSTSTGKEKKKAEFCRNNLGITTSASGVTLWIQCVFIPTTLFLISYGK